MYERFHEICKGGNLDDLKNESLNLTNDMIKSTNYYGPRMAIIYNNLEIVKYIFEKYEENIDAIIECGRYWAPRYAIANGH